MSRSFKKAVNNFLTRLTSLSTLILPQIITQISFGESFRCSPIAWDPKSDRFRFMKQTKLKLYIWCYKLLSFITTLRSFAILFKTIQMIGKSGQGTHLSYQVVLIYLFGFLFGINWLETFLFGQEAFSSEACVMFIRLLEFRKRHKDIGN